MFFENVSAQPALADRLMAEGLGISFPEYILQHKLRKHSGDIGKMATYIAEWVRYSLKHNVAACQATKALAPGFFVVNTKKGLYVHHPETDGWWRVDPSKPD